MVVYLKNVALFCRQFDTREQHECRGDSNVLLVGLQRYMGPNAEAKCIAINPRRPELLAIGANDVYARVYDRRMISLEKVIITHSMDLHIFSVSIPLL